jgi:hypothetical protein
MHFSDKIVTILETEKTKLEGKYIYNILNTFCVEKTRLYLYIVYCHAHVDNTDNGLHSICITRHFLCVC